MGIASTTLTDEQLAAAGAALRSFHGHLSPDSLNHTTQLAMAAMIVYICAVFEMDPAVVCTALTNNAKAITSNPDLLRYVIDQVSATANGRRIISLPVRKRPVLAEVN